MDVQIGPGGVPVQQRPSLSYFIFLSLLFFMMSNHSPGLDQTADRSTVLAFKDNLERRMHRRDGLATWLGRNTTFEPVLSLKDRDEWDKLRRGERPATEPVHEWTDDEVAKLATDAIIPYPYPPTTTVVASPLVPTLQQLLERPSSGEMYHQNLTGYVRGEWATREDWTYEKLGLPEVYNTTTRLEYAKGNSTEKNETEETPPAKDAPRKTQWEIPIGSNATHRFVNFTVETNRTQLRGVNFPWQLPATQSPPPKGQLEVKRKITFNLREDVASATGPVLFPPRPGTEGFKYVGGEVIRLDPGPFVGEEQRYLSEGAVTYLKGDLSLTITDPDVEDQEYDIEGVHFVTSGLVFAYVTPPSFPSHVYKVPPLADFAVDALHKAKAAGMAILGELDKRLDNEKEDMARNGGQFAPATSTGMDDAPRGIPQSPRCSFQLFGSISPLPASFTPTSYAEYYRSLFHPTGSSLTAPPPPTLDYVLFSPDCAIVIEGKGTTLSSPTLWERATNYAAGMALVQCILAFLLVRQMEWGNTPSATGEVAYLTIGLQIALDAHFFIIHFTVGIVTDNRSSLPVLIPAFFAAISSLLFGVRYAAMIHNATPYRAPPPPAAAVAPAAPVAPAAEGDEETDPLVTRRPVVAPVPAEAESAIPSFSTIALIVGAAAALTIIIIWGWIALLIVATYSYWIPQIVVNVERDRARRAFKREYIVGTTICRLALPVYIWANPNNILFVEPSGWVFVLVLYSCTQAAILLAQSSRLGSRFFLPIPAQEYLGISFEPKWEYHPPMTALDIESGTISEECCICLEKIHYGIAGEAADLDKEDGEPVATRWDYMVPPCHHVAHSKCLESWLAIKSVCPVCRRPLPPL